MAQSPRSLPANYPQPLGNQILKAEALRQASIVRQEILTELLSILAETREPNVRSRLIKLVEGNLRSAMVAASKAENLWPELDEVQQTVAAREDLKPAVGKKHLKIFEQLDRLHRRSLSLLTDSFAHIRIILDRMQPPEPTGAKPVHSGMDRKG